MKWNNWLCGSGAPYRNGGATPHTINLIMIKYYTKNKNERR